MFKEVIFSGRSEIIEQKQLFLYPGGALLLDRSFIYVAHQAGFLRTPRSSELRLRLSAVIRSGIMKIHVLCLLALTDAERDLEGLGRGGRGAARYPCSGFARSMKIQRECFSSPSSHYDQIKSFVLNLSTQISHINSSEIN